jgi:hypothetical protein
MVKQQAPNKKPDGKNRRVFYRPYNPKLSFKNMVLAEIRLPANHNIYLK